MTLDAWLREAADELGRSELALDRDQQGAVLDLAKVVAHSVARPAAPLTAFLAGYLAGTAGNLDGLREIVARLSVLAEAHAPQSAGSEGSAGSDGGAPGSSAQA